MAGSAAVQRRAGQGFPGREQFGGLELELLHRQSGVGGAWVPPGRSPPDQAARGFTCPAPCSAGSLNPVYAICQTSCTVTTVQYPFRDSQCGRVPTNLGESRQGPAAKRRRARLGAMTTQATGDEPNPAAEQPRPAAEEPPPAAVLEPALNPLQRLIQQRLRERGWSSRGRPPRRPTALHRPYPRLDPEPGPPAAPGHHRRAGQGPGRAGLRGPRCRCRVHRAALLRRGPRRAERPATGAGATDRQHRRADTRERRHVAALVESLRNRTAQEPQDPLASPARGGPGQPPGPPRGHFYPIGSPAGTPSGRASSSRPPLR